MRLHELSWSALCEHLAVYETLDLDVRELLRSLRVNQTVDAAAFGTALPLLLRAGILKRRKDETRVAIRREASASQLALRAGARSNVLRGPSRQDMRSYIQLEFDSAQRAELFGDTYVRGDIAGRLADRVVSRDWIEKHLDPDYGKRLKAMHADPDGRYEHILTPRVRAHTAHLVKTLVEYEALRVIDLPDLLEGARPAEIDGTFQAALRYMLVFPGIDPSTGSLILGLHPGVRRSVGRRTIPPPVVEEAELEPLPATLVADVEQIFVDVGGGHVRLKADGDIFKKDLERIAGSLMGVGELDAWDPEELEARVDAAVALALSLELIAEGPDTRGRRLVATKAGAAWIAEPAHERTRWLLERVGLRCPTATSDLPAHFFELRENLVWGEILTLCLPVLHYDTPVQVLAQALIEGIATLPQEGGVPFNQFAHHQATECNPLLGQGPCGDQVLAGGRRRYASASTERREALWLELLLATIERHLARTGGLRVGENEQGTGLAGLTPMGAWLVGLSDDMPAPEAGTAQVVVQPTFDVIFLAPDADAERELSSFCERTGQQVGAVFRITKASVLRGAGAGLPAEAMLAALDRYSRTPVPDNVRTEIPTWHGRQRVLRVRRPWVLDCGNAETANRVLAAAPKKLERLSEHLLALRGSTRPETLAKHLAEHGITLDTASARKERTRAPRRRRYPRRGGW